MNVQVLMSVMNANCRDTLKRSNISTDAIIVNQTDRIGYENINYKGHDIKFLSFPEKGVGLSRNSALMRGTGSILLFADEDETFIDNYEDVILREFKKNPKADMIMFNVPSSNIENPTYLIQKSRRVRRYNALRYGATKIAVKSNKVQQANSYFSVLFGGGTAYAAGEDSMFIYDCLRKGMRVYSSTQIVGYVSQTGSSWFNGYNDKYFRDMGVFFYVLSPRLVYLYAIQFIIRGRAFKSSKSWFEILTLFRQGIKSVKEND